MGQAAGHERGLGPRDQPTAQGRAGASPAHGREVRPSSGEAVEGHPAFWQRSEELLSVPFSSVTCTMPEPLEIVGHALSPDNSPSTFLVSVRA